MWYRGIEAINSFPSRKENEISDLDEDLTFQMGYYLAKEPQEGDRCHHYEDQLNLNHAKEIGSIIPLLRSCIFPSQNSCQLVQSLKAAMIY